MAEPARRTDAEEEPPLPIRSRSSARTDFTRRVADPAGAKAGAGSCAPAFLRHLLSLLVLAAYCHSSSGGRSSNCSASDRRIADTSAVESPETYPPEAYEPEEIPDRFAGRGLGGAGERLTWLGGMVLALSTLMGWYVNSGDLTVAVIAGIPARWRSRAADRPRRRRPAPAACGRHPALLLRFPRAWS